MNRPNITAGPWTIRASQITGLHLKPTNIRHIINAEGKIVSLITSESESRAAEHAQAIAAVPQLLDACEIAIACGSPSPCSLYDEEAVEGWRWEHPDGREWTAVGDHNERAPAHPVLSQALLAAGYTK